MTNNIYQKLVLATAGTALSLVVMETCPAHAATITYDFTLNLTSGSGFLESSVGNQYSGSFSYDDSQIFYADPRFGGFGAYLTTPTDFSVNFNNTNYTEANLIPFGRGGLANLSFFPGGVQTPILTGFQFLARDQQFATLYISSGYFNYTSNPFGSGSGNPNGSGGGTVNYSLRTTAVPDPEDSVYALVVIGLGWLLRKKIPSRKRTCN